MHVVLLSKALISRAYRRKCELIAAQPGITLTVLTPPAWGAQQFEPGPAQNYMLRQIPLRLSGNFHLHHYPTLAAELRAARPNLVHIDEEPYNFATWHALRAARAVGARTLFFTWQNLQRNYPPPFGWMENAMLRAADGAIAGNDDAARILRAKRFAGPLAVIPQFGVDEAEYSPSPGAARDGFVIGFAGRLVPEKGVDVLLRALTQLPDARLVILGNGPEQTALQTLCRELGLASRVSFEPARPSSAMPAFYRGLHALVLPSRTRPNWKEQFGRVLIEAMACGVPVIGAASGEIPNVIGAAGLLFPEGDAGALAATLRNLIASPQLRAMKSTAGRERVLARFTMRRVAEESARAYKSVVGAT